MKKDIKLYNMIFPTYMLLFLSPLLMIISILGNFVIDSVLVVIISLTIYKKVNKNFYLKSVFVAWGFGFLSDIIGAFVCFIPEMTDNLDKKMFLYLGIIVSAVLILFFNYISTFSRFELNKTQRFVSALAFAIFTAPYTFLIPNEWFA